MAVTSRQGLIDYCLRELGAPVIEINVAEEQIEDRVDEALEFWRINHWDGCERTYYSYKITQTDINNRWIPLSDDIFGVTRVLPIRGAQTANKNIFDLQYQLRLNDLYDLTSTSIIYYTSVMNHLSMLDHFLVGHVMYRFNRLQNRLYIDCDWGNLKELNVDDWVMVDAYRALDPATFPRVWGEPWLRKYTTALIKKQWGANLKKFSGLQLPGGVALDGDSIYNEGVNEANQLEEELIGKSAPLEFFTG